MWKLIKLGLGNHKPVGEHPGTAFLFFFVLVGGIIGLRSSLFGSLVGSGVMLLIFGPLYLYGAYERGKWIREEIEKTNS